MSEIAQGGCACGAVRYRLRMPPMFVHCCHCLDCQRQTGSAFAVNALIEADRMEMLSGNTAPSTMPTDSGHPHEIHRCTTCGVALWSEYGGRKNIRFVRTGTLDQPATIVADVHIYTRSKQPWVTLPPGKPAFEAYYDARSVWSAASLERRRASRG